MITRRQFLHSSLAVAGAGLLTGMYSWRIEPRWVEFSHQDLPIAYLPAHLDGRLLIQISDMHLSDRYDWHYQLEIMWAVQALEPDYVVYTGDFITYESGQQYTQLREVRQVMPRGRLGTAASSTSIVAWAIYGLFALMPGRK